MKTFNRKETIILNIITSALLSCQKVEVDISDFTKEEIESFKHKIVIKRDELKKRTEGLQEGEKGGAYIETSILIYDDILEKLKG